MSIIQHNDVCPQLDAVREKESPVVKDDPSQADLIEMFSGTSTGGPNPFYRCKSCDTTVPGVHHYLVEHYNACI